MDSVQEACESLIGEQFQEYLIESMIAIGTYGAIFQLKSTKTQERFAGKCLFKAGLNDVQIELQREEVKFNRTVGRHPNICHLENFVETQDHMFLVFELCDGGDLYDAIKEKKVEKEDIQPIFNQILSGIQHCHSKGVFHRDMKPENVLINSHKSFKIADFGLATYEKTPIRHKIGSTQYMAPELFDLYIKHYKSEKVDVWALAVILFNLVTGSNPWSIACPSEDHQFLSFLQRGARYFRDRFHLSDKLCQFFTQSFNKDFDSRPTLETFRQSFNSLTMDDLLFRSVTSFSFSKSFDGIYSPPRSVEKSTLVPKSPATALSHKFAPSSWADDEDFDIDYDEPFSLGEEEDDDDDDSDGKSDDDSDNKSEPDIQFHLDINDDEDHKHKLPNYGQIEVN